LGVDLLGLEQAFHCLLESLEADAVLFGRKYSRSVIVGGDLVAHLAALAVVLRKQLKEAVIVMSIACDLDLSLAGQVRFLIAEADNIVPGEPIIADQSDFGRQPTSLVLCHEGIWHADIA
jgi:hypothetical protein